MLIYSISRPHGGLTSSSWALWARDRPYVGRDDIILWALWARDRQYAGRDNTKTIPYGSTYRGILRVEDVTFPRQGSHEIHFPFRIEVFKSIFFITKSHFGRLNLHFSLSAAQRAAPAFAKLGQRRVQYSCFKCIVSLYAFSAK